MIILGNFAETMNKKELPSISDNLLKEPAEYKTRVLNYLCDEKRIKAKSFSYANDVFTGETIPQTLTCSDDGVYVWRSDFPYYVDKYNLKVPDDFIAHIDKQMIK